MNIKITKAEFDYCNSFDSDKYLIGSRLYGTNREDSDYDYLYVMYESPFKSSDYYPNFHQLQYDDLENNTQHIFTTISRFYANLFSGDSSINADIVMFSACPPIKCDVIDDSVRLNYCRTYNIIKSYLGFAKRDILRKNEGKNKHFHVARGLYCADELINNRLPLLSGLSSYSHLSFEELMVLHNDLRKQLNSLYDANDITTYPKEFIVTPRNSVEQKLMESNNIKQFKY